MTNKQIFMWVYAGLAFGFFNAIFHNSILAGIINGTGLLLGGLAYETYQIRRKK